MGGEEGTRGPGCLLLGIPRAASRQLALGVSGLERLPKTPWPCVSPWVARAAMGVSECGPSPGTGAATGSPGAASRGHQAPSQHLGCGVRGSGRWGPPQSQSREEGGRRREPGGPQVPENLVRPRPGRLGVRALPRPSRRGGGGPRPGPAPSPPSAALGASPPAPALRPARFRLHLGLGYELGGRPGRAARGVSVAGTRGALGVGGRPSAPHSSEARTAAVSPARRTAPPARRASGWVVGALVGAQRGKGWRGLWPTPGSPTAPQLCPEAAVTAGCRTASQGRLRSLLHLCERGRGLRLSWLQMRKLRQALPGGGDLSLSH